MPLKLSMKQHATFSRLRAEWLENMQPFNGYQLSDLFEPLLEFSAEQLGDCKLLPKRENILDLLPKDGVVAEIGTQEGEFSRKIYDKLKPKELHLFDIEFDPFYRRNIFPDVPENFFLHKGDSSTLLSSFPDQFFDIIYIDGDHSYEGVKKDADVAIRKIKSHGYLWFNDFTIWSPIEMIDYGVPYVVSEICRNYSYKFAYFTFHPLMYCDVVLVRISD